MAIGTGLAIGLGLASAGAQVAGSVIAAKGSKDAAKIQTQSADKALGIQKDMYDKAVSAHDPYLNLGRSTAGTLGRLMQPGVPYTPALQREDAMRMARPDTPPPMPGGMPPGGMPRPRPGTLGSLTNMARPTQDSGPMGPVGAPGGRTVLMESPDGRSRRPVPAHQVDKFRRAGARVVG